jgi:hypothetical protein
VDDKCVIQFVDVLNDLAVRTNAPRVPLGMLMLLLCTHAAKLGLAKLNTRIMPCLCALDGVPAGSVGMSSLT